MGWKKLDPRRVILLYRTLPHIGRCLTPPWRRQTAVCSRRGAVKCFHRNLLPSAVDAPAETFLSKNDQVVAGESLSVPRYRQWNKISFENHPFWMTRNCHRHRMRWSVAIVVFGKCRRRCIVFGRNVTSEIALLWTCSETGDCYHRDKLFNRYSKQEQDKYANYMVQCQNFRFFLNPREMGWTAFFPHFHCLNRPSPGNFCARYASRFASTLPRRTECTRNPNAKTCAASSTKPTHRNAVGNLRTSPVRRKS